MYLENLIYLQICENLAIDENINVVGFDKLKKSISLLHSKYLIGASREGGKFIEKYPKRMEGRNIFDFVISIYNKRIKFHHSLFLIIHIYETALRSKIATILSDTYSSKNSDDWFHKNTNLAKQAKHIAKIKKSTLTKDINSFEVLDLYTLGDLENIIKNQWAIFKPIFSEPKEYKMQQLPEYGTKEHLLNTFTMIRKARNDIFHNNPPKLRQKSIIKNIEILLLRLGFNIKDAFENIDGIEHILNFKYKY